MLVLVALADGARPPTVTARGPGDWPNGWQQWQRSGSTSRNLHLRDGMFMPAWPPNACAFLRSEAGPQAIACGNKNSSGACHRHHAVPQATQLGWCRRVCLPPPPCLNRCGMVRPISQMSGRVDVLTHSNGLKDHE